MKTDPTLVEIWAARQSIWQECNQDLEQLLAFYEKRQSQHPERLIVMEELSEEIVA